MEGLDVSWTDRYQKEHRASWEDIAEAIHDSVTMDEAVHLYIPGVDTRYHRIPCPIHNGKDRNFSYTDRGYKCFVCGASGDVISFVQTILSLRDRTDAMKRINADFRLGLPLDREITVAENKALEERRKALREKEERRAEWEAGYHRLWDEWCRLDRQRMFCLVGTPTWAEAVKNIDRVAWEIDCYPVEEPR
jgi:hypothetical protein